MGVRWGGRQGDHQLRYALERWPAAATAYLVAARRRTSVRSIRASRGLPPLVAALCGGILAAVAAYLLLPQGTINLDELVYLNQAEAIRHGELTYDAATYDPDFRPYLTGVAGDRLVFKYQPLWPAWLAISEATTGDHRPGLVMAGAGAALAVWLLARELTGSRWLGTAAAAGLAASPIFLAHSGTALAYLPASALAAFAIGATLRSERTTDRRWAVLAGVAFGALFFHRPFDAALAGIPVGVWHILTARRRRQGWRTVAAVVLGAAPFVVAWAGYNDLTSGSPTAPAFAVDAPDDRFGFGRRASWHPVVDPFEDQRLDYTAGAAAGTVGLFAVITPMWLAGGVVSLALAGVAVVGGWSDTRRRLLLTVVVAVIGGHFFWWGTRNFLGFGLHLGLGPAYWMAALGPVAALTVQGAHDVAPTARRALAAGLALAVLANWSYAGMRLADARRTRAEQVRELAAGDDDVPAHSVVLAANHPGDPFVRLLVPVDLDATPRLHAVDLGTAQQRFRLRDRFPDRSLWVWQRDRRPGAGFAPFATAALQRLPELRADHATVTVQVAPDATVADAWLRVVDDAGAELRRDRIEVGVGAAVTPEVTPAGTPAWLAAGVALQQDDGEVSRYEVRWAVRADGATIELMGPGIDHRLYDLGGDQWVSEDVSGAMTAAIEGLPDERPVRRARIENQDE